MFDAFYASIACNQLIIYAHSAILCAPPFCARCRVLSPFFVCFEFVVREVSLHSMRVSQCHAVN